MHQGALGVGVGSRCATCQGCASHKHPPGLWCLRVGV